MQIRAHLSCLVATGLVVSCLSGCGRTDIIGLTVRQITVAPATQTIGLGQTIQFNATASPSEPGDQFEWALSSTTGGSISSSGLYTAPVAMPGDQSTNLPVTVQARLVGTAYTGLAHIDVVPIAVPPDIILVKVSGDNQTGTAGQPLPAPLIIRAVNAAGTGIPGVLIEFASPLGMAGSASVATSLDGTAQADVSAGAPAGTQSFIVSTTGAAPVSFTATIGPGALASIFASDSESSGFVDATLSTPLSLVFTDQFGNPIAGRTAVAGPPAGGSAVPVPPATSDSTGTEQFQITLGSTPGAQAFAFTDSQDSSVSTTFTFTANPRPAAAIVVVSGGGQGCVVGTSPMAPLVVEAVDANDQPVEGAAIAWSTPDGGSFTNQDMVTNANGIAQATVTCGQKAGSQQFLASAGNIMGSPATFTALAKAGPAAEIILQGGAGQSTPAGTPFPQSFVVLVVDSFGNPVGGVAVQFSATSGGGSITATSPQTNAQGLDAATMVAGPIAGNDLFLAAVSGLANSPITLTLAVSAPLEPELNIVSGANQTGMVGQQLGQPLVVQLTFNNQPMAGTTVTFSAGQGGGTVVSGTVMTDANGQAQTNASLGAAPGPQSFSASVAGAIGSPVVFSEQAVGQVVGSLEIVSGNNQSADVNAQLPQPLVVQALDETGNIIQGVPITFTAPSGAQISPASVVTDPTGQASATAVLGSTAGNETFVASAGDNISVTFTETAVSVVEVLTIASGNNQTVVDGAALANQLVVQLTDNMGNPIAGVPVQWQAVTAQASVSQSSVLTDNNGNAAVTAQLAPTFGAQTFTASVTGAVGSPVTFTETNTVGPPVVILIQSGNNQSGPTGSPLPQPIVVKVVDAGGNGVSGVSVTFAVGTATCPCSCDDGTCATDAQGDCDDNTTCMPSPGSLSVGTVQTQSDGTASATVTLGSAGGTETFTATSGTLAGSPVTFTETATAMTATVTGLSISPVSTQANVGGSVGYAATAQLSNGTNEVVTTEATWTSSNTGVATISDTSGSQGLALAAGGGTTTITGTFQGFSATATLTVQAMAVLQSIVIAPPNASLSVGTTLQLSATGVFSDGSTTDVTQTAAWSSGTTGVATISTAQGSAGLVSGVAAGTSVITVSLNGVTATETITVIQSSLNNLQITPTNVQSPAGTTVDFQATATFDNGTVQDVTSQVTWSSSNTSLLTIANSGDPGVADLFVTGMVTVTANLNGQTATETVTITSATLTSLQVAPNNSNLTVGDVQQFTATGTFSDGSTEDLTASVQWGSDDSTVASVSNTPGTQGVATAVGMGQTQVTATLDGMQASANISVDDATPIILRIFQYSANGIPNLGNLNLTCIPGGTIQVNAGTFDEGGMGGGPIPGGRVADVTEDATWTSSNTSVAIVDQGPTNGGLIQCVAGGNVTISASYKGNSDSVSFTVSSATLQSIAIEPASLSLAAGASQTLEAVGTYSDGSMQAVTTTVTWTSSNQMAAIVSNASGLQGQVTAVAAGNATITATLNGVTATANVTVGAATLSTIVVSPANTSISQTMRRVEFQGTAVFTDGSTMDITSQCAWASTKPMVATITSSGTRAGEVMLEGTGTTQISCTYENTTGSTSLTVF